MLGHSMVEAVDQRVVQLDLVAIWCDCCLCLARDLQSCYYGTLLLVMQETYNSGYVCC